MSSHPYVHLGSLRGTETFKDHLSQHDIAIPCDDEILTGSGAPLQRSLEYPGKDKLVEEEFSSTFSSYHRPYGVRRSAHQHSGFTASVRIRSGLQSRTRQLRSKIASSYHIASRQPRRTSGLFP